MGVVQMKQLLKQVFISDIKLAVGTLKWPSTFSLREMVFISLIFRRQLR